MPNLPNLQLVVLKQFFLNPLISCATFVAPLPSIPYIHCKFKTYLQNINKNLITYKTTLNISLFGKLHGWVNLQYSIHGK